MNSARLARAAGVCAVVGGAAWVIAIVIHAQQPIGCVGDECLVRPQRESTAGTSWLVVLAAVALTVFLLALLALLARAGDLGWSGMTGMFAVGLGIAALALMALPPFREQARPLPALIAIGVGLALLAWTVLRSRVVPTWAGIGLVVAVLLFPGVNEQNSRVVLALPFGMAWIATGAALLQRSRTMARARYASVDDGMTPT